MIAMLLGIPLAFGATSFWLGVQAPLQHWARYGVILASLCALTFSGFCTVDLHRLEQSSYDVELPCKPAGRHSIRLRPCAMPGINVLLINKTRRVGDPLFPSSRLVEFEWRLKTVLSSHAYAPGQAPPGGEYSLFDVLVDGKPSILEYTVNEQTGPLLERAVLRVRTDRSHWDDAAMGSYVDRFLILPLAIAGLIGPCVWAALSLSRRRDRVLG